MTAKELPAILAAHKEWLDSGYTKGARADLSRQDLREFAETLSDANLRGANLRGANLSGANLSGANLSDANLSDANLRGAYLSDANLSDANLSDANLSDANLSDANLSDANLSDANLSDANLRGAYLSDANLRGAYLSGANLSDANLRGAYLSGAYLSGANGKDLRTLLAVPELDKKILAAIESPGCKLNMQAWHTCETTHCRAGWTVVIAGEKGSILESLYGTCAAASLIYAASRPDKTIPDFFATNEAAMESIRADAAS